MLESCCGARPKEAVRDDKNNNSNSNSSNNPNNSDNITMIITILTINFGFREFLGSKRPGHPGYELRLWVWCFPVPRRHSPKRGFYGSYGFMV